MRWYDYITMNIFWLGLNIRNLAVQNYIMPYMVILFVPDAIKNTALGGMRAAGLVIAMLVQPAAGMLSDRSTSRFGRRRPFILIGVLGDLLFLAAIAFSWNYVSLLLAILLIQFTSNISHGALQGLIPDLVSEEQRGRASAVKAVMELLPVILVGLTIAKLIGYGHLDWAIFVTGASLLLIMLITVIFVKETPLAEKPDTPFWPPMIRVLGMLAGIVVGALAGLVSGVLLGGIIGLLTLPFTHQPLAWAVNGHMTTLAAVTIGVGGGVAMIVAVIIGVWAGTRVTLGKESMTNASFTWWIVNRLMFLAAITSIQGSVLYFVMYAFNLNSENATNLTGSLNTVIGVFIVVTALASGWLADRLGRRLLVGISGLVAAIGGVLLLTTIWVPNLVMIYVAGIIIGLGTGLFMTANWALGTDLVPSSEAGRYLGVSNLAGAGAGIVGAGIGGIVADQLNLVRPGLGYFAIFASYAVLFALSSVSLLGVQEARK
jgi:MFS family permease